MTTTYIPGVNATSELSVSASELQSVSGAPARSNVSSMPVWLLDPGVDEAVAVSVWLPTGWATYDVEVLLASGAGTGDVVMLLQGKSIGDTEALGSVDYSLSTTVTVSAAGTMTAATLATGRAATAGDTLKVILTRDADNVADNLAGDVGIIGLRFTRAS